MGTDELIFPLDAADYPRKLLVRSGRMAIYAISTKERILTKIGIATDIYARLGLLQCGNGNKLYLYYAGWVRGKEIAQLLELSVHLRLRDQRTIGEWFSVDPTAARKAVLEEAARICGGVHIIDHRAMVEKLHSEKIKPQGRLTISRNRRLWDELTKSENYARNIKMRILGI